MSKRLYQAISEKIGQSIDSAAKDKKESALALKSKAMEILSKSQFIELEAKECENKKNQLTCEMIEKTYNSLLDKGIAPFEAIQETENEVLKEIGISKKTIGIEVEGKFGLSPVASVAISNNVRRRYSYDMYVRAVKSFLGDKKTCTVKQFAQFLTNEDFQLGAPHQTSQHFLNLMVQRGVLHCHNGYIPRVYSLA